MSKTVLINFGRAVRNERKRLGLSQEELAERAHVHRTYVGMIERGEKNVTLTNVEKISQALGMAVHELVKLL